MDGLGRARRDLVVVEGCKDILRVAPIDAVAVAIQHVHCDKMGPGIHFTMRAQAAAAADNLSTTGDFRISPNFIRVDRPLGEGMSEFGGAENDLQQVFPAGLKRRNLWPERSGQWGINRAARFDAEDVQPHRSF